MSDPLHPPYVLVNVAVSVDGFLDSAGPERLVLSNDADWDAVDELRAGCDAVLIGAGTLRSDNPSLRVKNPDLIADRVAENRSPQPMRVVLTRSGQVDPSAKLFAVSAAETMIIATGEADLSGELPDRVRIVRLDRTDPASVLNALAERSIRRLLIEGGSAVLTEFLAAGGVDELRIATAPFFVGEPAAPRFVGPTSFPHGVSRPMRLGSVEALGSMVVTTYLLDRSDG